MLHNEAIGSLKSESTWQLLGLGIITLGVYFYHYVASQTHQLNYYLSDRQQVPQALLWSIFVTTYTSLALFLWSLFVEDDHPVMHLDLGINLTSSLLLLVWGFYARNRMNLLNQADKHDPAWFHALWTFLLTPLYFNFKINVLNLQLAQSESIGKG